MEAIYVQSGYRKENDNIVHYDVMGNVIASYSAYDKGAQELLVTNPLGRMIWPPRRFDDITAVTLEVIDVMQGTDLNDYIEL